MRLFLLLPFTTLLNYFTTGSTKVFSIYVVFNCMLARIEALSTARGEVAHIGSVNYLQRFVPHLSAIASPLNELLRKDVEFVEDHKQKDYVAGSNLPQTV